MKPCSNCRTIHQDDYNGTCMDCGAPMSGVQANRSVDLSARRAAQIRQGERETGLEQQMKRGNYDGVPLEQSIVDVARSFVIFDEEKARKIQEKANA